MATTFTLIDSYTVGSGGAASIDFTSIPSTYTDLVVKFSARVTGTGTVVNIGVNFNGSSSSFTNRYLGGNGSTASSGSLSGTDGTLSIWTGNYNDTTSNTFGNAEIYIPNYAGSNNKSFSVDGVAENNATDGRMAMNAMLWSNTAAINRVTLIPQTGSFMQYSTATLYGVKNA
jgi:hypothetical protein